MAVLGAFALVVAVLVAAPVHAADHTVGGSSGWTTTGDYSTWAAGETFKAGDTLTFNYNQLHTVAQVSKADYESCSSSNAIKSDSSGATKITLDKPATTYYFICGTPGHCSGGMKVSVATTGSGSGGSATPASGAGSTPAVGAGAGDTPTTGSGAGAGTKPSNSAGFRVSGSGALVVVMGVVGLVLG